MDGTPDPNAIAIEDAESVRAQRKKLPLYTPRVKVFPKRVSGVFRRLKTTALVVLLGIYYLAPWLRWDRGPGAPDQAFLIDMPSRRAYFLWIEIWPQEVYYLAGLLIVGAFGLFLVTSLFGRVWCGFTCPQTVWTDLFMWVERWVEGDRNARIKLDQGAWTAAKITKRTIKHLLWLLIALLTGGAWILYFHDAPTLVQDLLHLEIDGAVLFFIGLFTATTYLLAGFAREQVCTYMCPWPRFQAAMLDEDTLTVTYEEWRGEPRGHRKKDQDLSGLGDCVACNQCVAVCPTGIDIRDGSQLECIGCALCVDACNSVMAALGRPPDLITYDSVSRQLGREQGATPGHRLVRPRTVMYAVLLLLIGGAILFSLWSRPSVGLNVIRDRNPLFVKLSDGSIRNGFTVKILNKQRRQRDFALAVNGLSDATVTVVGQGGAHSTVWLAADPDAVTPFRIFVTAPARRLEGKSTPFLFVIRENAADGPEEVQRHETVFRGPVK